MTNGTNILKKLLEDDSHIKKTLTDSHLNNADVNEQMNSSITCKEVKIAIKKLKNDKSAGLDLICNEFLKHGSNILTLPIVKLFNKILITGQFPVDWNISVLSVIHKNGSLYDCNSCRGISISICLGRLFTKILQTRISKYLEDHDIIRMIKQDLDIVIGRPTKYLL